MADVRQILTTKAFENAVVLAGHEGLSNPVKTITVAEVPDAADWLQGGEIVCTTGFFVRNSPGSQVQWIESLIQHNASALAIKTTRFIGEISDAVKLMANSRQFPIIGLPGDSTWPFVIESVMNLINDEQVSLLRRAEKIHSQLVELVLSGSSVSDIGQALANLVNNPVIVEDGRLNLLSSTLPMTGNIPAETLAAMEKYTSERIDRRYQETLLHSDYYRRIMSGRSKEVLRQKLSRTAPYHTLTLPVMASNVVYGFLTLIEVSGKHSLIDIVALEHGATAISLKLVQDIVHMDNQRLKEQEAIQELINGRLHTSILRNHVFHSIDWSNSMVVVLIDGRIQSRDESVYTIERPELIFERTIRKHIRAAFRECILGYDGTLYTLLVSFAAGQTEQVPRDLQNILTECFSELQKKCIINDFCVAVGGIHPSRSMLQKSYEEAQKTLEVMTLMPTLGPIAFYEQIGIYRLIHLIKNDQSLSSFRNDYLAELIEHDRKNSDSLCETLYTYLKLGGNVTAAAKHLFVHPNTVSYRIRKIHAIIGDQLDDPEHRASLLVALKIDKYLTAKQKGL